MKRVLVLVEGQTEERFVKDILAPHCWTLGKDPTPKVVTTKRVKRGPDFKGGISEYQKVENDLYRLLGDSGAEAVTTFIDYYALPSDFPGMRERPQGASLLRARHVEAAWAQRIGSRRFRPFLMLHEFEALLFVNPELLGKALYAEDKVAALNAIRAEVTSPEEINDDPRTAPSKRILSLLPGYQKTLHGPIISGRIGLTEIRRVCPHFNEWLSWLEEL